MGQLLILLVGALVVAAVVFGVTMLVSGNDPGLAPVEPDGRAVPLPANRPLGEGDVSQVRFDTVLRGYRMAQVDQALRRAAYDIGYKDELIGVLTAEVAALREGRTADAEALKVAREAALAPEAAAAAAQGRPVGAAADDAADRPDDAAPGVAAPGAVAPVVLAAPALDDRGAAPAAVPSDATSPGDRGAAPATVPSDPTAPDSPVPAGPSPHGDELTADRR